MDFPRPRLRPPRKSTAPDDRTGTADPFVENFLVHAGRLTRRLLRVRPWPVEYPVVQSFAAFTEAYPARRPGRSRSRRAIE